MLLGLIILGGCANTPSCYVPDSESLFISDLKEISCDKAIETCIDEAKAHYERYYSNENVTLTEYYKHVCNQENLGLK